jgi:putative transposase
VLQRGRKQPRLNCSDRILWIWLSRLRADWRAALAIVKSETVIGWHRKGFRLYWAWKSWRTAIGRRSVHREIRNLIRIHGELLKLGINLSQATVAKYMGRQRKPPSQSWHTFLNNRVRDLVAVDFFTVPMASFRVLFVFVVLAHNRRRHIHFNVTEHPTAEWTARQILQAFPWDTAPRYLIRDRDGVYGEGFRRQLQQMDIHELLTAPRSPWQNAYAERLVVSIRQECLDHIIVLNESSL